MANILIVDGHRVSRDHLGALLSHYRHGVTGVADAQEALAEVDRAPPDLVIIEMAPGWPALVQALRDRPGLEAVPVLLTVADDLGPGERSRAAAAGVVRVLGKPFDEATVLAAVFGALARDDTDGGRERVRALEIANAHLSGVVEFCVTLGRERDLGALLEHACASARSLTGATIGWIGLTGGDGRPGVQVISGLDGVQAPPEGFPPPSSGAVTSVLEGGGPLNWAGPLEDAQLLGLPLGHPPVESLLAVALRSPERCLGWVCVTGKRGAARFHADDEALIRIVASRLGVVVENLLLCQRLIADTGRLEREVAERKLATEARWRSEREASRAEARYRAVVDTAVDAMVVIDAAGVIQSFNQAAERMFGHAAADVVGRRVDMLMPEPHRSAHGDYLERYRRTGVRTIIGAGREVQGVRRDGSVFPIDLSVAEWFDGDERYFTGILRDVTQRKEGERTLNEYLRQLQLAKAEAERANLAKSKFLAAASHDLRQPAQSLVLFLSTLSLQLRGHPSADLVRYMEQALNGLTTLLDALLDVSKLDAGVVAPQFTTVPLGHLLDLLAGEYQFKAERQGLSLRVVRSSLACGSDATLLERLIRNLIENALRYTRGGSILIGCRRRGASVRIDVIDTGIGIPPDKLEVIFEEFYQIGNAERLRAQGLGLGLAIVHRLSKLLNHPVEVASTPGRGSRFSVTVPQVALAPRPGAGADGGRRPSGGLHILVIDDEPTVLTSLRVMLEAWGHRVTAVGGPEAAHATATSGSSPPDLIVADYRLGGDRTGTEVIADLHQAYRLAIPGVVLTGDTAPERIAEARRSGFRVLHKPVTAEELAAVISRQGRRPRATPD